MAMTMNMAHAVTPYQCKTESAVNLRIPFNDIINLDNNAQFGFINYTPAPSFCSSDQVVKQEDAHYFGDYRIQYLGGQPDERLASLFSLSASPKHQALLFSIKKSYADTSDQAQKGRVQMEVFGNKNIKYLTIKMRVKLGDGFLDILNSNQPAPWIALSEWWNNGGWNDNPYPFSFFVYLKKVTSNSSSYFNFEVSSRVFNSATKQYKPIWQVKNPSFRVPIGEWFTLDYSVIEGNATHGYFKMTVTVDNQKSKTLFEVVNYTHHPDDKAPDGYQDISPIKLYTSGDTLSILKKSALTLLIDQLEMSVCTESDRMCRKKIIRN